MKFNRRKFFKYSGVLGGSLLTGSTLAACGDGAVSLPVDYTATDPKNLNNFIQPLKRPDGDGFMGVVNLAAGETKITAKRNTIELLKEKKVDLFTYEVVQSGKTFTNPIFRVKKGQTFSANLTNNLGEATNIHWHGLHLDWRMDGHPSLLIANKNTYQYSYPVQNRGGTYWYHPHPHKLTAKQAYMGLAGFYLVDDEDNQRLAQSLDLKVGESDLPILLQDKLLGTDGKLFYSSDTNTQFMGVVGDTILTNFTVNPVLEVATRIYRLRLLNGSNARTYRLAFVKGQTNERVPYWLVGTDAGLLDKPYEVSQVFLSPGERIELLLDLKNLAVGDILALKSLAFDPMHTEMGEMNMGTQNDSMSGMDHSGTNMANATPSTNTNTATASRLNDGEEFFILKLVVKSKVSYDKPIPRNLSSLPAIDANGAATRTFKLAQSMTMQGEKMMMQWFINNNSYQMEDYLITVKKGSTEIWEFYNETQSMPHPMHLHGFSFRVIERRNSPAQLKGLATYEGGRLPTDLGWKDTVLVWPGETVRVALDFSHNFEDEQNYVLHCHVLEHEDNGMMLNYRVS
jgi:blue copper oxidase